MDRLRDLDPADANIDLPITGQRSRRRRRGGVVVVVVAGVVVVVVVVGSGGGGALAPTWMYTPSTPGYSAVNVIVWKVPFSITVPHESFSPLGSTLLSGAPVTVVPEAAKPLVPLTRVMLVPAGKSRAEPSEPMSRVGFWIGAPN